jgi:hypothetical protein
MRQISIVFSKHTTFNPFSSLIMWGLKTPYSHVAIKMVDGDTNQVVYYQASGLSVNCVSQAQFLSKETIIYQKDISVSDKVYIAGKTFTIIQLGKPYAIMAILGFAWQVLCEAINVRMSNPIKATDASWVCSQLGAGYIDACENIQLDMTNMTPKALYELMPTLPDIWQ